ncbi:hypothetical protein C8R42DRAFT_677825 [Lentinula raphanica]|nr:hypothetical protein C8R42DRAFT_677825 [Lentinula raphanica]
MLRPISSLLLLFLIWKSLPVSAAPIGEEAAVSVESGPVEAYLIRILDKELVKPNNPLTHCRAQDVDCSCTPEKLAVLLRRKETNTQITQIGSWTIVETPKTKTRKVGPLADSDIQTTVDGLHFKVADLTLLGSATIRTRTSVKLLEREVLALPAKGYLDLVNGVRDMFMKTKRWKDADGHGGRWRRLDHEWGELCGLFDESMYHSLFERTI